jgi:hypothetical protein
LVVEEEKNYFEDICVSLESVKEVKGLKNEGKFEK